MSSYSTSVLGAIMALTVGGTLAIAATPSFNDVKPSPSSVNQTVSQRPQRVRGTEDGDKFMEQLNLTEDQKRQISAIREKYKGQLQQARTNIQTSNQELETMMAGNASNEQLRAKHQEMMGMRDKMNDLRFESLLEMRQVLTPAQRSQLAQLTQERKDNARTMRNQRRNNNQN
ncbi:MAG: hypothetical protein N5P05_001675 [Chroococcopsis gigantea SAG 12.99]|jgi:protein CpxP|nr:hypothetical protein [Chroococcopsis gigantea SAG 12.99]